MSKPKHDDDLLGWHPTNAEFEEYLQKEIIHAKKNLDPTGTGNMKVFAHDTLHSHETCQKALKEMERA